MLSNLPHKTYDQITDARLAQIDQRLAAQQSELERQAAELLWLRNHLSDAQLFLIQELICDTVTHRWLRIERRCLMLLLHRLKTL